MTFQRSICRTPSGAMLWEIWSKHRGMFTLQVCGLMAALLCVSASWYCTTTGPNLFFSDADSADEFFKYFAVLPCPYALLFALMCFCYAKPEAGGIRAGIPGRLLLKPISTIRLVAVPMVSGGIALVALFIVWVALVLSHYYEIPMDQLPWFCAALLSLVWSVQAVGWSTQRFHWSVQIVLVSAAGLGNVYLALIPLNAPEIDLVWRLAMLAGTLAGSFGLALVGVKWERAGAWNTDPRAQSSARSGFFGGRGMRFKSPFRAQFWFEWRRHGFQLPLTSTIGISFLLGFTFLLLWVASFRGGLGLSDGRFDESITLWIVGLAFITPLMCAVAAGGCTLFTETGYPPGTIPPFVAIRPMRSEGYLGPKLAVIGASCGLTWLIALTMIGVWLALVGDAALVSGVWKLTASNGLMPLLGLGAALFVVLTLLLWRTAIAGMWLALAGGENAYGFYVLARFVLNFGAIALIVKAIDDAAFRATLEQYLTPALAFGLVSKLIYAVGAFRSSLARRAISREGVLLIVVGWLALGSFVAITGKCALAITPIPGAWIWMALGGFYLLPLSGPALAPAAVNLNRHR